MNSVEIVDFVMRRRRDENKSSSSSSSEDEWEAAFCERGKRKLRPRICGYYNNVVNLYDEHEFKSHFRMSRDTFEFLSQILHNDLRRKIKGCPTIPVRQQLMIAIWKIATMDSYRSLCDRFNVGRATAVRAVRRVTNALFKKSNTFIQWPTGNNAARVMQRFKEASGFLKIVGAIDGTHIRIEAPKENPADYINRKGYHSINLQVVCDHRAIITYAYAGHAGCVHDKRVCELSEISDYLNDERKFEEDSHIVGDTAYELHEHLLIPFRNNGYLTGRQKNYNYKHSVGRVIVERCIGLLKGRMRSLLHCLPMRRVDLMAEYIIACCVIHNICMLRRDEIDVIAISTPTQQNERNHDDWPEARQNAGVHKRNIIMNMLEYEQ